MSFLSAKLDELMKARNMTPAELGRRTGVDDSKISRWLTDKTTFVSLEDLEALCGALGHTKIEQAGLIRAHLLDECHGPGEDLIQIKIRGERSNVLYDSTKPPLNPKLERAFEILREHVNQDSDLQTIIVGLGEIFGRDNKTGRD